MCPPLGPLFLLSSIDTPRLMPRNEGWYAIGSVYGYSNAKRGNYRPMQLFSNFKYSFNARNSACSLLECPGLFFFMITVCLLSEGYFWLTIAQPIKVSSADEWLQLFTIYVPPFNTILCTHFQFNINTEFVLVLQALIRWEEASRGPVLPLEYQKEKWKRRQQKQSMTRIQLFRQAFWNIARKTWGFADNELQILTQMLTRWPI